MYMTEECRIRALAEQAIRCMSDNHLWDSKREKHALHLIMTVNIRFNHNLPYQASACIIHSPAKTEDGYHFDRITLQLGVHKNPVYQQYIIYHEISHLLSIGEIQRVNAEKYLRPWGLCSTSYIIQAEKLISSVDKTHYAQNEQLNECLACFLFEQIQKEKLPNRIMIKRGKYASINPIELLHDYLSHHVPLI